jgi:hypothetical protein
MRRQLAAVVLSWMSWANEGLPGGADIFHGIARADLVGSTELEKNRSRGRDPHIVADHLQRGARLRLRRTSLGNDGLELRPND